jgi:hypothetical protein
MNLEPLESAVLEDLLDGNHPVLAALRDQIAGLSVVERERTGTGFFTKFETPPATKRAPVSTESIRFGDVVASIDGLANGAGFLLYVDGGLIRMLEGYSFEEPWPEHVRRFSLRFAKADRSSTLSQLK